MRTIPSAGTTSSSSGFASPAIIIILVLILGATIYLWRQRYMRRKTAYVVMGVLTIAIIAAGFVNYSSS